MKDTYTTPELATVEEEPVLPIEEAPKMPFWQKVLIYCGVWLLLTVAAFLLMWNMMVQYENAQPQTTVNEFLHSSRQYAFHSVIDELYPDFNEKYESTYDVAGKLASMYSADITYTRLSKEYTYENPVYLVSDGETMLFKLILEHGDVTGFLGLKQYIVKDIVPVNASLFETTPFYIVLPLKRTNYVYVNGQMIGLEDLPKTEDVTVFGSKSFYTAYLGDFFFEPKINVTYGGKSLPCKKVGNMLVFDYENELLRTVNITVPTGATVTIEGLPVTSKYPSVNKKAEADIFGSFVDMTQYSIPTMASENPDISVNLDGTKLEIVKSGLSYIALPIFKDCQVVVPSGATLYANGVPVSSEYVSSEYATWLSSFDGCRHTPTATKYSFSKIYEFPEFSAELDGVELASVNDDGTTVFILPESEELKASYSELAKDFIKEYLHYTTQGLRNTRKNLDRLLLLVANPSTLYTNLQNSYIGYYYIATQDLTLESIEAESFIPFGDEAFTCTVTYKVTLKNFVGEVTEENTVELSFAKLGGEFFPVHMAYKK